MNKLRMKMVYINLMMIVVTINLKMEIMMRKYIKITNKKMIEKIKERKKKRKKNMLIYIKSIPILMTMMRKITVI